MLDQSMGYGGWLEKARQRRDQYDQESMGRAEEADQAGQGNINMFSNATRTMLQNNMSRAQADPQWDAWSESTQGAPLSARGGANHLPSSPMQGLQAAQMSPGAQVASYPVEPPGPLTPADRHPRTTGGGPARGIPISTEELASRPRTGPQPWEPPSALKGLQRAGQGPQPIGQGLQIASQGLQRAIGQR